jgi:hypothetical protein
MIYGTGSIQEENSMKCEICGKELAGDLDTFGPVGQEACYDCWTDPAFYPPPINPYEEYKLLAGGDDAYFRNLAIPGLTASIIARQREKNERRAKTGDP